MSNQTVSVWRRMSENSAGNASAFQHARIEVSDISVLACPDCGLEESALFWTAVERSGRHLRLACPACQRPGARYDLRRNRGRAPVDVRRIVVTVVAVVLLGVPVTGAAYRYAPPREDIEYRLERSRQHLARTPTVVRDWLATTADRVTDAVFDRR